MRYRIILLFALIFCFVIVTHVDAKEAASNSSCIFTPPTSNANAKNTIVKNAEIQEISPDQSTIQVGCGDKQLTILIQAPELKPTLPSFIKGDRVNLEYSQKAGLQSISVTRHLQEPLKLIATLLSTAIGLVFVFWLLLGLGAKPNLQDLIIGLDNRYSNSKTQIVLWFFVVIVTYISLTILRSLSGGLDFVGGIEIPQNLLLLSGLSALTFVAAKGITQDQVNTKKILKTQGTPNFPADLFRNDNNDVDLGDFQMIIVTLLAVGVYLVQIFRFLGTIELHQMVTLPDVDTTILATFGLGQGTYLAKKFVSTPGPGGSLPAAP